MRILERKIGSLIAAANIPEKKVTYGIAIAKSNSDPSLSVSYTDDAVNFIPSSGNNGNFIDNGWKSRFPFNKIKPCLLKNGALQYYLNPNDFTKKMNGTESDITSGADGDVMIEFPKIWYSITQDDNFIYVRYSNTEQIGFTDWGMSYKGVVKERFYIGAYFGSDVDGKLCSLSGKTPINSLTIGNMRLKAQTKGNGYEQLSWNKLIMLQILYLVRFKNLDSQTALGNGYTVGSSMTNTGATDNKGMNYGDTIGSQIKFCGIEDFWGNLFQLVDGFVLNADGAGNIVRGNIAVSDGNYNDTAAGYSLEKSGATSINGGISAVMETNKLGFTIAGSSGSSNTYFCDYGHLLNTGSFKFPVFGGNYVTKALGGVFYLRAFWGAADSATAVSGRLIYCG